MHHPFAVTEKKGYILTITNFTLDMANYMLYEYVKRKIVIKWLLSYPRCLFQTV